MIKTIYFATSSWEKYRTVRNNLETIWNIEVRFEPRVELPSEPTDGLKILHYWDIDVNQIMEKIPDYYDLSRRIAIEKAEKAFAQLKQPCIAMDSGFFVEALRGYPGPCVGFALQLFGDDKAPQLIVDKLKGITNRGCYFAHHLAYIDEHLTEPMHFTSQSHGSLSLEPRPRLTEMSEKSPFWRVFEADSAPVANDHPKKAISEMTKDEYVAYSQNTHRYITDLGAWLEKERTVRRR